MLLLGACFETPKRFEAQSDANIISYITNNWVITVDSESLEDFMPKYVWSSQLLNGFHVREPEDFGISVVLW